VSGLPKPSYHSGLRVHVNCPLCDDGVLAANFYPEVKARTYGPPEQCYPGDPPEVEWESPCPACGEEIGDEHYDDMLLEAEEAAGDDY